MHYLVVSFTHKNTNIQTREKLAFNDDHSKELHLKKIVNCTYILEAILLSTCNRIEITAFVADINKAKDTIFSILSERSGLDKTQLLERADIHENEGAVHHLFTVVSSLDSLVVGETQIAGQFKDAFRFSHNKGYSSNALARVAQFAFKCAGAVRNATNLGTGSVSVASTAVSKAKEIYGGDGEGVTALVIGAGEMSELTVKHLLNYNFNVVLISRDIKKAQLLASTFEKNVEVKPYDQINYLINHMPLLFTATSAPYPIITKSMVQYYQHDRYWFDIALPRDIEAFEFDGIEIFAVDDLQCIVDENMSLRAEQAKQAYSIVSKMSKEFFAWLNSLGVEPLVKGMHLQAQEIINEKINKAIKKHYIDEKHRDNIQKLCLNIMNEFLHQPSKNLRELSKLDQYDDLIEDMQKVFNISNDDEYTNDAVYKCNR